MEKVESEDAPKKVDREQSVETVLRRQAEERDALKKQNERIKGSIPKKDRRGRQRAAETAVADVNRLALLHNEQLEEEGISPEEVRQYLESLTVSDSNKGNMGAIEDAPSNSVRSGESKAARRRRKKAEQEAEAARRVAEEKAGMGPSAKSVELHAINDQLNPKQLRIHPIAADGHCLYGAIAHQMQLVQLQSDVDASVEELRKCTAGFLRSHKSEFMPFIETVDGDDVLFERYCNDLQNTAAWGGQVELNVLAKVLKAVIEVYAADMPVVRMGSDSSADPVLRVSFHRQYLGLGEHYNSVVPHNANE